MEPGWPQPEEGIEPFLNRDGESENQIERERERVSERVRERTSQNIRSICKVPDCYGQVLGSTMACDCNSPS